MKMNKSLRTGLVLSIIWAFAGCGGGSGSKSDESAAPFYEAWEGKWYYYGENFSREIIITDVSEQSFDFSFEGFYFTPAGSANMGFLEGTAPFTEKDKALFEYEREYIDNEVVKFAFEMVDGKLVVTVAEGDEMGVFGWNVHIYGDYKKSDAHPSDDSEYPENYEQALPSLIAMKVNREGEEEIFTGILHERPVIGYAIYLFPEFEIRKHPNDYDIVEPTEASGLASEILMRIYRVHPDFPIPASEKDNANRIATDYMQFMVDDDIIRVELVYPYEAGDGALQFMRVMAKSICSLSATDVDSDYIMSVYDMSGNERHKEELQQLSANNIFSLIHEKTIPNLDAKHQNYLKSKPDFELIYSTKGNLFQNERDDYVFVVYDKTYSRITIIVFDDLENKYLELYREIKVAGELDCNYYNYGTLDYLVGSELVDQYLNPERLEDFIKDYEPCVITDVLSDDRFILDRGCFAKNVSKNSPLNSLCIATSLIYNNWDCLLYDKQNNKFIIVYGQAFSD